MSRWTSSSHNWLPKAMNVPVTYSGSLGPGKWFSLVAAHFNPSNPCSGQLAASTPSSDTSGVYQAPSWSKTVHLNTNSLSTATLYAVCYAQAGGYTWDSTWADTGIRVIIATLGSGSDATPQSGSPHAHQYNGSSTAPWPSSSGGANATSQWSPPFLSLIHI